MDLEDKNKSIKYMIIGGRTYESISVKNSAKEF